MKLRRETPYKFFYKNAGYSVAQGETTAQGRRRSAKSLAEAERVARNRAGLDYVWQVDEIDSSFFTKAKPRWSLWRCHMILNDNYKVVTVASLGGIDFGRDNEPWGSNYKRVVEAELAAEYFLLN